MLKRRQVLTMLGGVLAAPALLPRAARGHAGHAPQEELHIYMGDLYFRPAGGKPGDPVRLEAGRRHMLRFTNEGMAAHEVAFGRDPDLDARMYRESLLGPAGPDGRPQGVLSAHLEGWQGGEAPMPTMLLYIEVPEARAGEWELGCFMPGHYEAGQRLPLIVASSLG